MRRTNSVSRFPASSVRFVLSRRAILFLCASALSFVLAPLSTRAQDYKMSGPYEVVARDGQYARTKGGSERDMKAALDFALAGKHDEARRIINAYAETLQRFDGHDGPLCCIQAFNLVRAMIEVQGKMDNGKWTMDKGQWKMDNGQLTVDNGQGKMDNGQLTVDNGQGTNKREELEAWGAMIRRAILPTIEKFDADSPYANGNWGAIVNRCRMACAIFLKDSVLYKASIDYYLHANDNGALPHYVGPTGQCQETGRDQSHAQLGLGMMCDICEMAWEQGDDLWGALDNRLMHGIEYSARYNLGYDVPFETWTDCTGLYCNWTEPGAMGRGRIWDIYRKPYEHYTKVKHQKMPYTKKVLALQDKAERSGKMIVNTESRRFDIPAVTNASQQQGQKGPLHQVFTYPAPEGAPLKHDYDVYVQSRGSKEWTKVDTYMAKVNATMPQVKNEGVKSDEYQLPMGTGHKVSEISYCLFDFTGDVIVKVISKNRKFSSARILPDYRGTIANVQNDSTVQFLLFQPENVCVELSLASGNERGIYSIADNLLVFTSRPPVSKEEAEREAKQQGRRFVYFPPGLYNQADIDRADICSSSAAAGNGSLVYLAGGSYFTGTFAINDAQNVSILGRGIARPADGYEGAHVYRSKNVLIDGLVVNTCPIGESQHVTLHDVRSISHPAWGDGLNVFGGSSDILFDRVFCRNSDDCTTAYATRKGFSGSVRNVRMRNSTLWADVAHPIFIGLHGAASGPHPERRDTVENLVYENIDILCQAEPQVDYQGCLAINCGDNNLVRNILFDNIRIEQIFQGSILQVKVGWNQKYCAAPGLGVENITFRNVRYKSFSPDPSSLAIINGYNEERKVRNITFEGLKINGQAIYDDMPGKPKWYQTADFVPMFVGNHVDGLVFKK